MTNTDIDIDVADRDAALSLGKYISALQNDNTKHKTSVYFQNIPHDPAGWATMNTKQAADLGYFKIDFLNNTIYKDIQNEAHLIQLLKQEPKWELFEKAEIVEKLAHIRDYFYVVKSIKPRNIDDLAVIIALIRPGKKHLIGKSRTIINEGIWKPVEEGYAFKKSHSYAYAASIIVQLNLM